MQTSQREFTKMEWIARGAISDATMVKEQAQSEARECPHCHKWVHPLNWAAHMNMYHVARTGQGGAEATNQQPPVPVTIETTEIAVAVNHTQEPPTALSVMCSTTAIVPVGEVKTVAEAMFRRVPRHSFIASIEIVEQELWQLETIIATGNREAWMETFDTIQRQIKHQASSVWERQYIASSAVRAYRNLDTGKIIQPSLPGLEAAA